MTGSHTVSAYCLSKAQQNQHLADSWMQAFIGCNNDIIVEPCATAENLSSNPGGNGRRLGMVLSSKYTQEIFQRFSPCWGRLSISLFSI